VKRRMRRVGGTPVEEAPVWALGVLTVVVWLVVFPAGVGLLNGFELVDGGGWAIAGGSAAISLLLVAGLARQKPWRRVHFDGRAAEPPLFVRFTTWLITTLLVPNVLLGTLVLFRRGEGLDYASAWLIGLLVSAIHGGFALAERRRRRSPK
jgi:hypothetical protein